MAVGTVTVRKANLKDAAAIQKLVNHYASLETMLGLSLSEIYDQIRDFSVAEEEGRVIGVCALHIVWDDLAEVRSLAVEDRERDRGVGSALVHALLDEARALHVPQVFALTYHEKFFFTLGFRVIDKAELPHKVWRDCLKCSKFPDCDEAAVIIDLEVAE